MSWHRLFAVGACALTACRFGFGTTSASDAAPDHGLDAADAADAADVADAPALDAGSLTFSGLLARYSFDDDVATGTVADTSGLARDAHCAAGVTCPTSVAGHLGNAASFNGTNQFANITYGPWLAAPSAFSFSVWVYLDAYADQVAFGKEYASGSDDSWALVSWTPGGAGTCWETMKTGPTREDVCASATDLPLATWVHVAGRWTGNAKELFVGGVKLFQVVPATDFLVNVSDVAIGSDKNDGNPAYYWHGRIDELQLYGRALTDQEIAMLAAQ